MTFDYRASQVQTNKLIVSGSTGTGARFLIYPIEDDIAPLNQGNIDPTKFDTSAIGTDVFVYISGSDEQKTVFGGTIFVSGALHVSESQTLDSSAIVIDSPSRLGTATPSVFTGTGIALNGFDPITSFSGSIFVPNSVGNWLPVLRHTTDYQFNTTDLLLGANSYYTSLYGQQITLQSTTGLYINVAAGNSVYFGAWSGDSIVLGGYDNGSLPPFDPQAPVLRMPACAGGVGNVDLNGVDFVLRSGLGTGAAIGSNFVFQCPEPGSTGDAAQTFKEMFKMSGEGYLRVAGSGSEVRPDASGGTIPGAIYYATDSGNFSVVSASTWLGLIAANSFNTFVPVCSYGTTDGTGANVEVGGTAIDTVDFYIPGFVNTLLLTLEGRVTSASMMVDAVLYDETAASQAALISITNTGSMQTYSSSISVPDTRHLYSFQMQRVSGSNPEYGIVRNAVVKILRTAQ